MIMDGKKVSEEIKKEISLKIKDSLCKPCLAVIQIGEDDASNIYVNSKKRVCQEVGFSLKHIKFSNKDSEEQIIHKIKELNNDKYVHGVIVQLPIDKKYNQYKIINTISENKDVDCLTDKNIAKLYNNDNYLIPCTPLGIIKLLNYYNITVEGKHVVIVGKSNLVGKPLSILLLNKGATVTICHSKTNNLKEFTKMADILVVAVGKKYLITSDMVKGNSVVIDVGINIENKKIYGDVDFENVKEKVSFITPTPGGVGPMTVAMLLNNVLHNFENNKKN